MENVGIDAQPEENKEEKDVNRIDSNLALNNFINSLEYTGLDRIRAVARAIASHKGEAVVEAAVALVDNEEQLVSILEAYKEKYPNAIQQLCCSELNQSSNSSDDSNPEGKIIKFENYNKTNYKT